MAALLVALAVMSVLMSVALPVWRHEAQREKEEELVWRGQQYIRALRLYHARTQALPGSVDLLVNGHFLRKKYKDPITGDDFELIGQGGLAGQTTQGQPAGRAGTPQTGGSSQAGGARSAAGGGVPVAPMGPGVTGERAAGTTSQASAFGGGSVPGGILGVRSKSKDESIRLYQGRNHYNEWNFIFVNPNPGGAGGRGQPGGAGGRGQPGRGGPVAPGGRGPGTFDGRGRGGAPFPLPGGMGRGGRGGGL